MPRDTCDTCGKPHPRCGAHRRDRTPCQQHPVHGAAVCRMHGGTAPQVVAAAEQRIAEERARKELSRLLHNPDAEPVQNPIDRLARLAGTLEHAADVIGARVSALSSVGIETATGGEQLRADVVLWEKLLKLLMTALDALGRHGWLERQTVAVEREAELWGQLVAAALDGAGVAGEARERGLSAARERLTLVAGGAA